MAVDRIARRHLACKGAQRELRASLERGQGFEKCDAIDAAHNQIVAITERIHYLTGLRFGIIRIEGTSK